MTHSSSEHSTRQFTMVVCAVCLCVCRWTGWIGWIWVIEMRLSTCKNNLIWQCIQHILETNAHRTSCDMHMAVCIWRKVQINAKWHDADATEEGCCSVRRAIFFPHSRTQKTCMNDTRRTEQNDRMMWWKVERSRTAAIWFESIYYYYYCNYYYYYYLPRYIIYLYIYVPGCLVLSLLFLAADEHTLKCKRAWASKKWQRWVPNKFIGFSFRVSLTMWKPVHWQQRIAWYIPLFLSHLFYRRVTFYYYCYYYWIDWQQTMSPSMADNMGFCHLRVAQARWIGMEKNGISYRTGYRVDKGIKNNSQNAKEEWKIIDNLVLEWLLWLSSRFSSLSLFNFCSHLRWHHLTQWSVDATGTTCSSNKYVCVSERVLWRRIIVLYKLL